MPTPATVPTPIVLNMAPADLGCDAIGWPENVEPFRTVTFRIDLAAVDDVTSVSDTGVELKTEWVPGFVGGTGADRVVRGPDGEVVVRDGDVLQIPLGSNPSLQEYPVCLTPTTLSVLLPQPGG